MVDFNADQLFEEYIQVCGELERFIMRLRQDDPGLADFAQRHYVRDPQSKIVTWKPKQRGEKDYWSYRLKFGVWMFKNWQYFGKISFPSMKMSHIED